jgi:hypothetical protein
MNYVEALYVKEATLDNYTRIHGEQIRASVELQPQIHKLRAKVAFCRFFSASHFTIELSFIVFVFDTNTLTFNEM